ncbi:Acetyltransferase, GNAT family [Halothece sp. PCC 7418]|uniref:GNAT family N-acetyltransferase n=1 Tax=Halothece sp. (strain PCC 7418) TaxID=65093 RepID=UPI0002A06C35|nr:GNAT family N-acetyltransferase [Halothece sp. PCC 7418]AFZ45204.1 Acetyltransferase, GNAT family [Halothece sp. PCC 7418]
MSSKIPEYQIRRFQSSDAQQIAQLFHDTIRNINRRDYSFSQVKAWAPDQIYFRNWATECSKYFTYVADWKGTILGFSELEANGDIHCFYCHYQYQGCGVGRQLYQTIENQAIQLQLTRLVTAASITAQPFFEKMGFSVVKPQIVSRRGETFSNYLMEKYL